MDDKLILHQCHFSCRIGCTPEERAVLRTIIIDIELFFDIKKLALSDELKNTIDYIPVHGAIKNVVEGKEYKLIETMAEAVTQLLLKNFPIKKVWLRLQKAEPIQQYGVAWVGIEITRP